MNSSPLPQNRRRFLGAGAALTGALASCRSKTASQAPPAEPNHLGKPVSPYGSRSEHETAVRSARNPRNPETSSSFSPLADSCGILTPSSLHYERHHSGVPNIDPASHRLLVHGMVDRPLIFTMADIRRLPSISRIYFLECSGNGSSEWGKRSAPDVQRSHGLASCSEWTGVSLALLFSEVGLQSRAKWLVAEGGDPCRMQRSIPLYKAMDDVLLAWGQNGEALRPEQGYPLRLIVPGWEGNINVKWLRTIKVTDQPYMVRDETAKYTDPMPDGTARIFTFMMEAKSVITFPSGGQTLQGAGFYEISGLAWSGRGKIARVEVSTDGGQNWKDANLQEPRLSKAFTRFRLPWKWDGRATSLASRATDESGYIQPRGEELVAVRGLASNYHNNGVKFWSVKEDGSVSNV
jgi:sulfane dehydrogenase subunit SoxC